jgi:hypothetical protein
VACSGPKIIPDAALAEIFRDAYLTNTYTHLHHPPKLDSLNIYEPIFNKYGYTTEDVQYTIGNFSKRKNARMADVVELAVKMLTETSKYYQQRIALFDTIGQIGRRRYAKVVWTDTLIEVRKIADTARLRIEIPLKEQGTYDVSYHYLLDSTDLNTNLITDNYLMDENGMRSNVNSHRIRRGGRESFTTSVTVGPSDRKLVLNLNGYARNKKMTLPNLTIDTLVVTRYLPDLVARDSMAREIFDYRHIDTLAWPRHGWPRPDSVVFIIQPDSTFFRSKPHTHETPLGTSATDS